MVKPWKVKVPELLIPDPAPPMIIVPFEGVKVPPDTLKVPPTVAL